MEYQKIPNLLDNTKNHPSKFRSKNCFEISDDSQGSYNIGRQIRFKTTMLKPSLCGYSEHAFSSREIKKSQTPEQYHPQIIEIKK